VGLRLPTLTPVIATAIWCVLFVAVALWRFRRESCRTFLSLGAALGGWPSPKAVVMMEAQGRTIDQDTGASSRTAAAKPVPNQGYHPHPNPALEGRGGSSPPRLPERRHHPADHASPVCPSPAN